MPSALARDAGMTNSYQIKRAPVLSGRARVETPSDWQRYRLNFSGFQ